jgi:hypothetical protein
MKLYSLLSSLLFFAVVQNQVFSQASAGLPLFQFNASQLSIGELTREDLKGASQAQAFGDAQSQGVFAIKSQNPTASVNVVELSKNVNALQIKVPPLLPDERALPVMFSFSGGDLGDYINPTKPLFIELTLQQGEVPLRFLLSVGFKNVSVNLAAVYEPDGPYRVFKTGSASTHDTEIGPPLPIGPVTLKFEIIPEAEVMTVNSTVFAQGSNIFEAQTQPQWLTRVKLNELDGLTLNVSAFADETRDGSINLISLKAWQ